MIHRRVGSCQKTSGSRNAVLPMSSTGLPAKYRNDSPSRLADRHCVCRRVAR